MLLFVRDGSLFMIFDFDILILIMILENNMIMSNHFDNIHIIHSLYLVLLLLSFWW